MPRRCLGSIPRLAVGIRLPDIVAPPVIKAFKARDAAGTLMLSYHRETAPSDVIASGKHILLGHSGTSITEYITKATNYADEYGALIEVEADHVSLMASPERAIKRITTGVFEYGLSESEIKESLSYIEREFREVSSVGGVDFVTIDTCELIDLGIDKMDGSEVLSVYEEKFDVDSRKRIEDKYVGRELRFISGNGEFYVLKFSREDVARLALKFYRSIEYVKVVYDIVKKYMPSREFGVEVALDEIPEITKPKELFFYLNELKGIGVDLNFIAPNVGFKKREDYTGDLHFLEETIKRLHVIASSLGVLLSFHSGSGAHPYSDKGIGTWSTVRRATCGLLKYKVSGVYIQLLLEVMSKFPSTSEPRRLYEEIFDTVLDYIKRDIKSKSGLYSPELERIVNEYEEKVRKDPKEARNPRADFFRHYFFIFQAVMVKGKRYLREKLLELYSRNDELRYRYEKEAFELTTRIIDKLGFEGNYSKFKMIYLK